MDHATGSSERDNRRLDSWKEIASFFDRDERTVRRWEKERSLPVHRMPGKPHGSVYAFAEELSQWLKTPNFPHEEMQGEANGVDLEVDAKQGSGRTKAESQRRVFQFAVAGFVVLVLTLGAIWFIRQSAHSAGKTPIAKHTPNAEALDLYLKGRYEWSKRSPESLNKAVDLFTQAIVSDPNYAQAYAGLADTFNLLREYTVMPSREAYPRAIAAAKKAVELDDSLSEAHRALAFASFYWTWDFPGAEREFKHAIELDPKDAIAHLWYATSLLNLGRFSDALYQVEKARELDPSSISIEADRALVLYYSQRREEFVSILKEIERSNPTFLSPHRYRADIGFLEKDFQTYLAETKVFVDLTHDGPGIEIYKAAEKGYASGGAEGLLNNVLQVERKYHDQGLIPGFVLAKTCALSGRADEAIQYLQEDFTKHEPGIVTIRVDPALASLHDDPKFLELIARIGLPPL
jgi:tetratricopeptide (TPR) repeat protein